MFYKKIINKEKLKTNAVLDDSIYNLILQKLFLYGFEDNEKEFDNLLNKAKNFTKEFFIQGEFDITYSEQVVSGDIVPEYNSFLHFSIQNLEDKYCKKIIDKINLSDLKDKSPHFFNEIFRDCLKNNKLEILEYLLEKNILTEQKINECLFLYNIYNINKLDMKDLISNEYLNDSNVFFNTLSIHTKNTTYLEKDYFWINNYSFGFNSLKNKIKDLNFEGIQNEKMQEMFDSLINILYKNLKTCKILKNKMSSVKALELYKTYQLEYSEKQFTEEIFKLFKPFIENNIVNLDKKYPLELINGEKIEISTLELFEFEKLKDIENFGINYRNEYLKNKISNFIDNKNNNMKIKKI